MTTLRAKIFERLRIDSGADDQYPITAFNNVLLAGIRLAIGPESAQDQDNAGATTFRLPDLFAPLVVTDDMK